MAVPVKAKTPTRRCIACNGREGKESLVRVVVAEGRLVWDRLQRLPGRGAYIHRRIACVNRCGVTEKWVRALRLESGVLHGGSGPELRKELYDTIAREEVTSVSGDGAADVAGDRSSRLGAKVTSDGKKTGRAGSGGKSSRRNIRL